MRCDDPIQFELLLVAVIEEIHTRVDVAVFDRGVIGDAGAPPVRVIADEITALCR